MVAVTGAANLGDHPGLRSEGAAVELLNKEFSTTILITESTYTEVGDEFECRLMPQTSLRGKSQAMKVYEVTSRKINPTVE
jgi:class 3 adenylate cyclase